MKNKSRSVFSFEVIFSDGSRKGVEKGFLLDLSTPQYVDLYGSTEQSGDILDAAETMLRVLPEENICVCSLAVAMALDEEARKVLADLVKFGSVALAEDVEKLRLSVDPEGAWVDGPFEEVPSEHS